MFEENKKKIIIAGALLLIIIAVIILIIFRKKPEPQLPPENTSTTTASLSLEAQMKTLPPAAPQKLQEEDRYSLGLKQLAFSFAERFGSYSNHSGIENLDSLFLLSTSKMKSSIGAIIAGNKNSTSTYESFGSRALSSSLLKFEDSNATVQVKTQRSHVIGDGEPAVYYQDITLKFLKVGNEWKVDEALWQ